MNNDIKEFVNLIKANTGIDLALFSLKGELLSGDCDITPPLSFTGTIADKNLNKTFFRLAFKSKEYIAVLNGAEEGQKSYAFLITQLAGSTKKDQLTKEQFISSLLNGDIETNGLSKQAKRFGIVDSSLFVMAIFAEKQNVNDFCEFLGSYLDEKDFFIETDDNHVALVKLCDNSIADYQSCTEYAEFLVRSFYEELGAKVRIGIGGIVEGLEKISESYSQALYTLDMMDVLQPEGDVHAYKEYLLIKILGDLPKTKINAYLSLLQDAKTKELFEDAELIETAESFLDNNLNASETSRKTFLHRNTLTYRLDKIERATGLNIRKFSDAITFRLLSILLKFTR